MKQAFIHIIIVFGLCCCSESSKDGTIDLAKSEKLVPLLNRIDFFKIELRDGLLTIDDTLIRFDADTSNKFNYWIAGSVTAYEWTQNHNLNLDTLTNLKIKINESGNYKIIKELDTYFFSEGGWIDSNYGKAYSKINISKNKEKFKFDRLQSIDPISIRRNWYDYYAD